MSKPPSPSAPVARWRWLATLRGAVRAAAAWLLARPRARRAPSPWPVPAGLYRTASAQPTAALAADAAGAGQAVHLIDLAGVTTKDGLLREFARRLDFPAYFGHNWDALDECLRDLAYRPGAGYLLLVSHADSLAAADPADWQTALTVFAHATAEPAPAARACVIVVIDPNGIAPSLPPLPRD